MSRVFVPQEPLIKRNGEVRRRYSLEPAREWGELCIVLDWGDVEALKNQREDEVMWKIRAYFEKHGLNRDDYILMTGDWSAMAICVHEALRITEGFIQLLQWDGEDSEYHVIEYDDTAPPSNGELNEQS